MNKQDFNRKAPVYIDEELESTNSSLKELGAESGTVLVARRQSGGRGRRGRSFESPEGGLYLSYLLRTERQAQDCSGLSALAALAVHDAVWEFASVQPELKWPNDLLLNGKKLCGILTEFSVEPDGKNALIIGIGLNLNTEPESFPEEIRDIACSLYGETGGKFDESAAIACIVRHLDMAFALWEKDKDYFLPRYRQLNICRGRRLLISSGGETLRVTAAEINDDLSLQVVYDDGRQEAVYAADVSVMKE